MSVTPPEAKPEYSRAPSRSQDAAQISVGLLVVGLIGALLLLIAEFSPLYEADSETSRIPLQTVHAGSHHAYALLPIGLAAIVLGVVAARSASRPALLALGALGIAAALIAVLGDLPVANATGLAGNAATGFAKAKDVPQVGFYLETLGAALLVVTSGAGILLTGDRSARAAA